MPERYFDVRWPDGKTRSYYSPSTSIHDHFSAGTAYSLADFLARARVALHAASERVRNKFGYTCSSAMDTLQQIEETAADYRARADAQVLVETIHAGDVRDK
jgi:uncharacterized repeat protein (TIGR04042 family)